MPTDAPDGEAPIRPLRLLLVDPHPAHVRIVRRAFDGTGTRLRAVTTAAEAREHAADSDLVLVEQQLPDGLGIELLRDLGVPGVLLTGDGDARLAVAAIKAGALDYVVKSETSLERLPRVVESAWKEWSERRAREAMERALRRSESHLRLAQEIAGVGSFEVDDDDPERSFASPGLARVLGRRIPDLAALLDAVHGDDRARLRAVLEPGPARTPALDLRFRVSRPEGDVRALRLLGRVERRDDGSARYLAGALLDVTEREEAESLLRSRAAELQQAQKMEAIGRLANGVAHDFNNLLMGVVGCADIALGKLDAAHPARPYVEALRTSAHGGTSVVAQLLAFGKRSDATAVARCALDEVVGRTERLLRTLLDEDIHLHVTRGAGGARVACEAGQLEQAIVNLAVNARHAMPGGGTLVMSTHQAVKDGAEWAVLTVADDGIGMTDEIRARIFEPFFTTKPREQGTGLGLTMVYGLVRGAGGEIEVESEVGLGTVFRLWLPAAGAVEERAAAAPAPASLRAAPPESGPRGTRGRVLVVEDHDLTRMAMLELLAELGWDALGARDTAEARAALDALGAGLDCLVSDHTLPDGSGAELAKLARSARPGLRVLFLTGHDPEDQPALVAALREPGTFLLKKPVELVRLADALESLVGHRATG